MRLAFRILSSLFVVLGMQSHSAAESIVELELANKQHATAIYQAGEADKAAVLLLHGFLQTREFPTIQQLGETLASEGYTVLQPTLSLGIDRRKSSLRCETIHTHHVEDSSTELSRWMDWLKAKGHKKIIGLGHSFGSLRLVAYQAQADMPPFDALLLTSLVYIGQEIPPEKRSQLRQKAEQGTQQPEAMPDSYALSFCQKYTTLPQAFLSYLAWDDKQVAKALHNVQTPTTLITGGNDNRIQPEWVATLQAPHVKHLVIEEANHFFNDAAEFDLQDLVLTQLADYGF